MAKKGIKSNFSKMAKKVGKVLNENTEKSSKDDVVQAIKNDNIAEGVEYYEKKYQEKQSKNNAVNTTSTVSSKTTIKEEIVKKKKPRAPSPPLKKKTVFPVSSAFPAPPSELLQEQQNSKKIKEEIVKKKKLRAPSPPLKKKTVFDVSSDFPAPPTELLQEQSEFPAPPTELLQEQSEFPAPPPELLQEQQRNTNVNKPIPEVKNSHDRKQEQINEKIAIDLIDRRRIIMDDEELSDKQIELKNALDDVEWAEGQEKQDIENKINNLKKELTKEELALVIRPSDRDSGIESENEEIPNTKLSESNAQSVDQGKDQGISR